MQRLSPLDALFLHRDSPDAPRQIASLVLLEPGQRPLDYDSLVRIITDRLDLVPRYRQLPRHVPGGVGLPVWVDDEHFDITLHVRRSALPRPGTMDALHELVGRLIARRLDHDRPLWELYLIEGLEDGKSALLFKAHQALVDGSHTVDLAQVLLEETDEIRDLPHDEWAPRPSPAGTKLTLSSLLGQVEHPRELIANATYRTEQVLSALPVPAGDAGMTGPLAAPLSRHRRFATASASLDDLRRVRDEHGGTVNDVILAVVAGGLRGWLLTRAEPVSAATSFRALVPMSVKLKGAEDDSLPTSLGSRVRGNLLSLPVGETNAVVRLHQVSYALKGHRETGDAVSAQTLADLPGFATSTFHAVGARVAEHEASRQYQLVVTNVPGPQESVYMAGQRLAQVFPAIPLTGRRTVAIGITTYRGRAYVGIVADREAVPDVDVLAQCIEEAVDELVETVSSRRRAPRGRQRPERKAGG
ncbi:wax ester/triacylglycerol synthase family O-acyltransferase [Aeromicrobium sp. YIM 150415]|uniref:wax ester/triacylglycerol synthase family O-acyltransferase n=1 Tax=Aeromicrobium sp. YIM 150415 TaxID=2803912 RepID=UPI001963BEC3|nr:wax ester/triacylglycerol synthase family O-acyltransferase [Aeromicrobium sp. YIM 150415]MBM9464581.1 wax ester/triacylglycerol synthase family O-acyltransferase [Aeromicrobium sp. YIM 150415]